MIAKTLLSVSLALGLIGAAHSIILDTTGTLTASTLSLAVPTVSVSSGAAAIGALALVGAAAAVKVAAVAAASQRGRRSADTCLPLSNPDLLFTLAANADKMGCALRFVCELEAVPDAALSPDEKLILGVFGRSPKPVTFEELSSSKASFQYAAFVGSKAKSPEECASIFNKCPFDRATLLKAYRTHQK